MQHPQEPQSVNPGTPMYPPGTVPTNPYYGVPPTPPAPRPSSFQLFSRTMRLILRRVLYGFARLGRVARPYALFLVVIALMAVVMGWMSLRLLSSGSVDQQSAGATQLGPVPAVETFIKGHQSFDADAMWSAYSADYQVEQIQKGFNKETLQTLMNRERTQGFKLGNYEYIGGTSTGAGEMQFYMIDLNLQDQQLKVPMIFTVDKDGKIIQTEGQLLQMITPHSQSGN